MILLMKGTIMVILNYKRAHKFVSEQQAKGNEIYWNGWDMTFFKPTPNGFMNKRGVFRNGRWGIETRISCDTKGLWKLNPKYVSII